MDKRWFVLVVAIFGNLINVGQHQQTPKEIDIAFVVDYFTEDTRDLNHCTPKCEVGTWLAQIIDDLFQRTDFDMRISVFVHEMNGNRLILSMVDGKPSTNITTVLDPLNQVGLGQMIDRTTSAPSWFISFRNMIANDPGNRPSAPDILVSVCEYTNVAMMQIWIDIQNGPETVIGRRTYEAQDQYCEVVSIADPVLVMNPTTTKDIADILLTEKCTGPRCPTTIMTTEPMTGTTVVTTQTTTTPLTTAGTPSQSSSPGVSAMSETDTNAVTSTPTTPVLEPWEIGLIAVAAGALLTIVIGLLVCCVRKRRRSKGRGSKPTQPGGHRSPRPEARAPRPPPPPPIKHHHSPGSPGKAPPVGRQPSPN